MKHPPLRVNCECGDDTALARRGQDPKKDSFCLAKTHRDGAWRDRDQRGLQRLTLNKEAPPVAKQRVAIFSLTYAFLLPCVKSFF